MNKFFATLCTVALTTGLSAAPVLADQTDNIIKAVSGKTLVNETAEFKVRKNGRLIGKAGSKGQVKFKGAWAVRDGKWCRTFTEPAEWAGTECQTATLGDGTITIVGRNGPGVWQIK